ncbi:PREDICTED: uncharacterized protein LOC106309313 [Brassica oleracea var. oleracea]|uniref:uncharacterized protein LOC106309313 n=1 Tax=Brassica oleracea var. oleracea TaxID=109376 RepID=UPI0006A6FEC4|nr:PREDICTED: uncharacterized protein LOC106309313 [Brassica oleracea var. oleracea]
MVHGYFKGNRGLWHGDPLSSYLFVIAMNILSIMLNNAADDLRIKYHHKCSSSRLTHLCFADDLLIFIDGSIDSVQNVLQVLKEFELRSGLAVTVQKSCFFASGLIQQEVDSIKASTGMPNGLLPVRYLGVPLCTKKLTLSNCEVLIQQVKAKFNSWTVKTLSFAGRLLLIKTVIAGITNFWCSNFLLHKACIAKINSLCGIFLWKGSIEGNHTARVSWETVTKSREGGGLGIKDLGTWNKACCLKLIWMLFFQGGSVWVAWFKTEILNGNLSNYWTVNTSPSNTWLANKLIKLRGEVYTWIRLRVGNGVNCRFWIDNWSSLGSLKDYFAANASSRQGIPLIATLSDLNRAGDWNIPQPRSEAMLQAQIALTTISLVEEEDNYEWVVTGVPTGRYKTSLIYCKLKGEKQMVPWAKIVWTKGGIPKHNFLTWLFVLDRCPTRDRLRSWGLPVDSKCLLCNLEDETRDHLYFRCSFSWRVLSEMARRCSIVPSQLWSDTINQLISLQGNKLLKRLVHLSWQGVIYSLWRERNQRLHNRHFQTSDTIIATINRQIKDKILSFRTSSPSLSSSLMQMWVMTEASS